MKMMNILVVSLMVNSFFLDASGREKETGMSKEQQQIPVTSKVDMDNTYILIQEGDYLSAYDSFISGVSKNDETLGGFIFETIVNGLIIFGYLRSIKIEDYGISAASVDALMAIPQSDVVCVFKALHDIAHNKEKFSSKSISECFKLIKDAQNKHSSYR